MKRHHPDLPGGNAQEAAEINWAYACLRDGAPATPLPAIVDAKPTASARSRRRGRVAGVLMLLGASAAILLLPSPTAEHTGRGGSEAARAAEGKKAVRAVDTFDLRSLPDEDAILAAVSAARELRRGGLATEALQFSRSCDEDLKAYASPSLLDHCVAFDAATGMLGGGKDAGWFRPEDMAARHVRAAMRVSDDPVLAEERLSAVRRKVEQLLVRQEP